MKYKFKVQSENPYSFYFKWIVSYKLNLFSQLISQLYMSNLCLPFNSLSFFSQKRLQTQKCYLLLTFLIIILNTILW